jgi:hypothetical protein
MANYMLIVELHNASTENYKKLHSALADINIYRVIKNIETGKFYVLPRACYQYIGDISNIEVIRRSVENAIKTVTDNYELVVTQSLGAAWAGLAEI